MWQQLLACVAVIMLGTATTAAAGLHSSARSHFGGSLRGGGFGAFHGNELGGDHFGGMHGGFGAYRPFPGYFGYGGYGLGLGGRGLGAYRN
jgi:hypothetical protein